MNGNVASLPSRLRLLTNPFETMLICKPEFRMAQQLTWVPMMPSKQAWQEGDGKEGFSRTRSRNFNEQGQFGFSLVGWFRWNSNLAPRQILVQNLLAPFGQTLAVWPSWHTLYIHIYLKHFWIIFNRSPGASLRKQNWIRGVSGFAGRLVRYNSCGWWFFVTTL